MKMIIIYRLYTSLREHQENCVFFDSFGIVIQLILGSICLSSVLLKRFLEKPRRPLIIWFLDTLKQVIGQFTQHFTNIFIAEKLGTLNGLSCEWYLYNLISDATLGIFFSWVFLKLLSYVLKNTKFEYKSGEYGKIKEESQESDEEVNWSCSEFLPQLLWWNLVVIMTKCVCIIFCFETFFLFQTIANFLFKPINYNPKLKLVIVMIICPVMFNAIQFWLIDNLIKGRNSNQQENQNEEEIIVNTNDNNGKNNNVIKLDVSTNEDLDSQKTKEN